jgi:hypothetical protein
MKLLKWLRALCKKNNKVTKAVLDYKSMEVAIFKNKKIGDHL